MYVVTSVRMRVLRISDWSMYVYILYGVVRDHHSRFHVLTGGSSKRVRREHYMVAVCG